jgi:2-polyprenyl-6-methoxyphenol hydroxylase-like FAD-dependent oxidoreductase
LLIIGGGPVGLAAAILGRLSGHSVTLIERGRPPVDKPCGEGLMPSGVRRLSAMGVALDPEGLHPFMGVRYIDGERVAGARFTFGEGYGCRRTYLQAAMARRAAELGAILHFGQEVIAVDANQGEVSHRRRAELPGRARPRRRWPTLAHTKAPGARRPARHTPPLRDAPALHDQALDR